MRTLKSLVQGVQYKFKTGDKVELIQGDYEGLQGKIVKKLPISKSGIIYYDIKVDGGYSDMAGPGQKGETNFHGQGQYGKIIQCQEQTLKKIR